MDKRESSTHKLTEERFIQRKLWKVGHRNVRVLEETIDFTC